MFDRAALRTLLLRLPVAVSLLLPVWYLARRDLVAMLAPPASRLLDAYVRDGRAGVRTDGATLVYAWARPGEEEKAQEWRPAPSDVIHINVVVLGALAAATPGLGFGRRLTALAVGLPLLYVADLVTLVMALRWLLVTDYGFLGPGAAGNLRINLTHYWPQLFLLSVGTQIFPVAAWLAGLAVALRPRRSEAVRQVPGRNDPCPCGSGLKYKRCCGAR